LRLLWPQRLVGVSSVVGVTLTLVLNGQTNPAKILELRYSRQPIAAGVEGRLQIDLGVKEGYKVAKRPAPKLQVSPTTQFSIAVGGFSESVANRDAEYFGGFKPLELKILPAKMTEAGKYSLEGKLTYFYCSERDKYCSRSVETVTIPIEVDKK
jgi:hypothetical protein